MPSSSFFIRQEKTSAICAQNPGAYTQFCQIIAILSPTSGPDPYVIWERGSNKEHSCKT
ncbi:hypothetical protein KDW_22290 [Dictyobacter vulcani]|uniref:Uncharacterized protein n=1 Tax=Dictyobacter vulcani TaxID=2607529 RepID=A0A5J4KNR8_9CHLR|nr:hypothetical protein KDW_22290 [Dictyobacter vulcani]